MTGGFIDARKSRLRAMQRLQQAEEEFAQVSGSNQDIDQDITEIDQKITQMDNSLHKCSGEKRSVKLKLGSLKDEQDRLSRKLLGQREFLTQKQQVLDELVQSLQLSEQTISGMKRELASDMQSDLSMEEIGELEQLGSRITQLSETMVQISKEKSTIESEKTSLDVLINKTLVPTRRKLERQLNALSLSEIEDSLSRNKADLDSAKEDLDSSVSNLSDIESRKERESEELRKLQNSLETLKVLSPSHDFQVG
jgi:structural maintenance of chromosome 3 (chondroitin sulfate proteoglycan 6)